MFQIQTILDRASVGHLDLSFHDKPNMPKPLTSPHPQIAHFPFAMILMFTVASTRLMVKKIGLEKNAIIKEP
jgi:hypothetical protein